MLILHGAVKQERFMIWAESSQPAHSHQACVRNDEEEPASNRVEPWQSEAETAPTDEPGKNGADDTITQADDEPSGEEFSDPLLSGRREPELLSFAASSENLRHALAEADIELVLAPEQYSTTMISVLESDSIPLASTPMIGRSVEDADPISLRISPYIVPVIHLDTAQVIDLLCYCLDEEQLAPGLLVGQDLRFWALAMRFAGTLVAKQQFLPGLKMSNQGVLACWDPVFIGEDGERLSQLAKGMPGSCLAAEVDSFDHNPGKRAFEILAKFINEIVDQLVRSSLSGRMPPQVESWMESLLEDKKAPNIHQRWIEALVGANPKLDGSLEEFAKLSSQIAEWLRPISVASDAPYRLCLRLEELPPQCSLSDPQLGEDPTLDSELAESVVSHVLSQPSCESPFYVRFLLQSLGEPGVLIPVDIVLSPSFEDLPLLRGGRVSAREYLFRSLGQAVRLCPDIEKSFAQPVPLGFELDTKGAHQFLSQAAPALKNAGFSVQLPSWWTRKQKIKAKAKVFSSLNTGTLFGLKDLAEFDWQLALGGVPLSVEELEKLAALKVPLVRWQGMWVEINPDEITPALRFFGKSAQRQSASQHDLIKMALGGASLPDGVEFDGITGEGRVVDVIRQLQGHADFEELDCHDRFQGELRPYQIRGMSWLTFLKDLGFGALLADDMGLGKTVQTLAFVQKHWYEQGTKHRHPTLLICPTSVIGNWQREALKFTPDLKVLVHHGTDRFAGAEFVRSARRSAIVLTSYTLLHKDYDDLNLLNWDLVILDEAQNVKNPETRQAIAACSLRTQFRVALTGTPVENSVGDLWSLMNFLNPGLLGSHSIFKEQYFKPIQIFQDEKKIEKLKSLTGPFILRRLKTDKSIVPDLPEKFERKTRCHLTKEQASLYAATVEEATGFLDSTTGMKRKSIILTTMLRLKQICNHPALVLKGTTRSPNRSGKLKRLTEMLEAVLLNDEHALIFTQFAQMGEMIQVHLQDMTGKEVLFLHGATPREERERMVERFQLCHDGPKFFVLSLKAGGTGLNLTRANQVFHFDRWWNPAVENQATDRAFRIGQAKDVAVHKFICAGTLEENIDEMIERKKIIASSTVGAGEGWLTELSTRELKHIFALKETAFVD